MKELEFDLLTMDDVTDYLDHELANIPGDTDKFHKISKALALLLSIEEEDK